MAKRIGKYKVSKRESAMSLIDGGTTHGVLHPDGGMKCNITALGDGISTRQLTAEDCGIVTIYFDL